MDKDMLNKLTKSQIVDRINELDGPVVTTRARKATLIEILEQRLADTAPNCCDVPEDEVCMDCDCGKVVKPTTRNGHGTLILGLLLVVGLLVLGTLIS